ncbi:preprotein translocase, SecE subunit [Mycobacterium kansasii 732]|uniref:Protein translocase subunit SecE n=1 Tax=Mycobacterium pseudokansasii TaxID=2341080 RepID=A0A498QNY1_9MYCO|nr:preprotein translocase subunit SecE [Mycobacterium pseudokansasii]EUA14856.1 preprotein translocase, SecE subunit [Mycobacterium kansasii 732]KZS60603.1 preprotein translocase subunit SecE [Mycobacterium kansasii]MBY0389719.1 preprotein translocase subunit SecE [Mycobacterium pseudokansasii]VAZ89837.1 Protein translocase subunit SecE [Mycobacterium pseudokansasii]VAZ90563.1 Protein translocase subunit SecE [Mycobacterium pseudokansasii]
MSDERDAADGAANDGGATEDGSDGGGRTAVVTKSVVRPQRPTGKRSRQRAVETDEDAEDTESSTATEVSKKGSAKKDTKSAKTSAKAKKSVKAKKATKAGRPAARSANPFIFVYNYMKQVVAEMRKVIWPNRRQMITYTSVVLVFLAFMVALVGGADLGLGRLVMLVFG